jgi:hypothetical protein
MDRKFRRAGVGLAVGIALFMIGCAEQFKQEEQSAKEMPIHCGTARGDIRVLQSEKANVAQQAAMGITMIYPASAVLSIIGGVEDTKYQVATGEYNDAIDKKIAQIKAKCGV